MTKRFSKQPEHKKAIRLLKKKGEDNKRYPKKRDRDSLLYARLYNIGYLGY